MILHDVHEMPTFESFPFHVLGTAPKCLCIQSIFIRSSYDSFPYGKKHVLKGRKLSILERYHGPKFLQFPSVPPQILQASSCPVVPHSGYIAVFLNQERAFDFIHAFFLITRMSCVMCHISDIADRDAAPITSSLEARQLTELKPHRHVVDDLADDMIDVRSTGRNAVTS